MISGDCIAARTAYHTICYRNFNTWKLKPLCFRNRVTNFKSKYNRKSKGGRKTDLERNRCFNLTAKYLEDSFEEPVSISSLCTQMATYGCEPYSSEFMKQRLIKKYGENLLISSKNGEDDIVSIRTSAEQIIRDLRKTSASSGIEEEKIRIVKAAALIIGNEIVERKSSREKYDFFESISGEDEALEFVPVVLQIFLQTLIVSKDCKKKIATLGQAIMQCSCPRLILAPLQVFFFYLHDYLSYFN